MRLPWTFWTDLQACFQSELYLVALCCQNDHLQYLMAGNGTNELTRFPIGYRYYHQGAFRHPLQYIFDVVVRMRKRSALPKYVTKSGALPLAAGEVTQHAQ